MRRNHVKQALAEGRVSIGSWVNLQDPLSARLLARAGFPWLTVDMEHSPFDWSDAAVIFGLIADAGCVPLCRPPLASYENCKRALDAGAWGIVAPMVDTAQQARDIVTACRYPPAGERSVGGGSHFLSFGCSDATYKASANDELLIVVQTESPEGIDAAEEIYAVEGVDAVFVGPNDLRARMRTRTPGGRPPTVEEFEAAMERVLAAGRKTGTPVGLHTFSVEEAAARAAQGFAFIACLSDVGFVSAGAAAAVATLGITAPSAPGRVAGGLGTY